MQLFAINASVLSVSESTVFCENENVKLTNSLKVGAPYKWEKNKIDVPNGRIASIVINTNRNFYDIIIQNEINNTSNKI